MRGIERARTAFDARGLLVRAAPWLPSLALAALALALYLATRSQVHTFDALSYIRDVDQRAGFFFHPHHLLYSPSGWLFWRMWRALGYAGDAELPLEALNSVAGAVCGAGMYGIVLRLTQRWQAALVAAGLLVFNYGFWYFSVEVEVYLLALLWLLPTLALLIALLRRPDPRYSVALGVTVGMAALYHQSNGLLAPIVVAAAALSDADRRDRIRALLTVGAISGGVVALGYGLAGFGYQGYRSLGQLVDWMLFFLRTGWWGHPTRDTLTDLGAGLGNSISPEGAWGYWLAIGALLALGGRAAIRRWPREVALCCVWIAVYAAFFIWWEAENIEFWIATLLPLWALCGLCVAAIGAGRARRAAMTLACLLPLALAWHNAPIVQRRGDPRLDLQRVLAARVQAASSPGDLIISPGGTLELYLPYYENRRYVRTLNGLLFQTNGDVSAALARLRTEIDASLHAGLSVLVGREALDPTPENYPRYRVPQAQLDAFWAPYRAALRPAIDFEGATEFWRIPNAGEVAAGGGWRWRDFAWGWQADNAERERFTAEGWCFDPQVDPRLTSPVLSLPAARVRAITLRMQTSARNERAQLFYAGPDGRMDEAHSVSWALAGDGAPHDYTVMLDGAPGWEGAITRLRLDPITRGDGAPGSGTCVESLAAIP